jgi:carbon monoxide dehydrogenase subunit G
VTVRVCEQVAVAAPPEAVWDAVVDWERQGEWVAFTTVSAEPGGHGVGERLTAVTRLGPVGFVDPMEVTGWDPPRRVDVRHLGRVVRGTATFRVEPAPGGARFSWVEDVEIPFGRAGLVGFRVAEPLVRLLLRRSLRRMARQLEARRRPGGG